MTTVWLIERTLDGVSFYWNAYGWREWLLAPWTPDAQEAVRFARKDDGEQVIARQELNAQPLMPARAVEHAFDDIAPVVHDCAALGCSPVLGWHVMHGFNDVAAMRKRALGRHYVPRQVPKHVPESVRSLTEPPNTPPIAPERLGDAWPPPGFEVWL